MVRASRRQLISILVFISLLESHFLLYREQIPQSSLSLFCHKSCGFEYSDVKRGSPTWCRTLTTSFSTKREKTLLISNSGSTSICLSFTENGTEQTKQVLDRTERLKAKHNPRTSQYIWSY